MPALRSALCYLSLAALAALALGGCASTAAEPGANTFYRTHHEAAVTAAAAVRSLESLLASSSSPPSKAQSQALAVAAVRARRRMIPPSEWAGPERGEEENLQQAETEVSEGAQDILRAIASLREYARTGRPGDLAGYRSQLRPGSEKWNEGVIQLWHLAGAHDPPTV